MASQLHEGHEAEGRSAEDLAADLNEALAQQAATSEILRIISRSSADEQPVFDAIVSAAVRLLRTDLAFVMRTDGKTVTPVAGATPSGKIETMVPGRVVDPEQHFPSRAIVSKSTLQFPDWSQVELPPHEQAIQVRFGIRSSLYLPMIRNDDCLGVLTFACGQPRAFTAREVALAESFRDQAIIAIENARLFNETREALEQQTATAKILQVIAGSPTDIKPVLQAVAESACEVCDAYDGAVLLRQGDDLLFSAHHGPIPIGLDKWPINRNWTAGRAIVDRTTVHVHDLRGPEGEEFPDGRALSIKMGHRAIVSVPLLREGEAIGVIVLRRKESQPFTDKQIALLQTFADQAIIAINNVHLFDEVQAKTHDLAEALDQQTATAEVLKVISRSAFNLPAVLQALLETAAKLCGAQICLLFQLENGLLRPGAAYGGNAQFVDFHARTPLPVDRTSIAGRTVLERRTIHVPDIEADPEYGLVQSFRLGGWRSIIGVPLMREGVVIGTLALARAAKGPFTARQIELTESFADQAVIAIENSRLFEEVQAKTRELEVSLEDLKAAQSRLIQTEKLASLGQLTAGIAHEIKNPLNFVNNFADLSAELVGEIEEVLAAASKDLDPKIRAEVEAISAMLKGNLAKIVQHGRRADSIVRNMLAHSREGGGERRMVDANAAVDEALNLAYHGARAENPGLKITLERAFDASAGQIAVFPQEFTRVLLNLFNNGFHAANKKLLDGAPAGFEPVLRVTTKAYADRIKIKVRDNGTGIPDAVKARVFEPFFTTKPTGEGTGLGLSLSHDIVVKMHGGRIDVVTEPGAFTEVSVTLPRKGLTKEARA